VSWRGADGAETLVCGVGPVEAAARTANALAAHRPAALLHVGLAGARVFTAPSFVIGSEALYCDADDRDLDRASRARRAEA